ncbi:MAG: alpha/beta hydrolase fold domain-containing protein [Actinophytocola sp.]|nr:alpha/beta hydrolase fold domain-containing protein [Actinophytocola sp.]
MAFSNGAGGTGMRLLITRRERARRTRLSYRSRALYAALWAAGHSVFRLPRLSPQSITALQRIDTLVARAPVPRNTSVTPVGFDGFEAEWVCSRRASDEGTVLYFHGGGFFFCGLNTHRYGVAAISARSGLPALSVAYRQLPETPIPGSVADCLTAYEYLLTEGVPAGKIVFAGDSAGGYLAFATALRARDLGLPLPAGIVAASPLLDIDSTARMRHANWRRETYIPVNRLRDLSDLWLGEPGRGEPPISPVNEDLTGMPPSLIMAAESEILLCDSEIMAERLWQAGAECKLQIWRGQVHAFPVLGTFCPETKAALNEIGRFIREATTKDPARCKTLSVRPAD